MTDFFIIVMSKVGILWAHLAENMLSLAVMSRIQTN